MNDLSDFQWLASAQGAEAWSRCQGLGLFSRPSLENLRLSARQYSVLEQQAGFASGLAKRKVSDPWNWFWTKTLLEQASDQWVAEETARDFPVGVDVVDGCSGAGVDSIALAKHLSDGSGQFQSLRAIDSSETACLLTSLNAVRHGFEIQPEQVRFEDAVISDTAWLHLDPDRRAIGRTVNLHATDPSWKDVATSISRAPGASVKAAPGFQPDTQFDWESCGPPNARRWISRDGSVRQQRLYWRIPRWANAQRIVTSYHSEFGWNHEIFESGPFSGYELFDHIENESESVQGYGFIADHDPALRAAGCVVALARRFELNVVGNEFGYMVGSLPRQHPMLRWFRVHDVLSLDRKKVRAMSRVAKVGRWELKSRNIDVDLVQWKKDLVVDADSQIIRWLMMTKIKQKHVCFVCEAL